MCGLFGVVSNHLVSIDVDRFIQLGFASSVRGLDSTGLIRSTRKGTKVKISTKKLVTNPVSFLTDRDVNALMYDKNVNMLAGHARAATLGHVNAYNAHPIHESNIIGMHNGTIHKYSPLKNEEHNNSDSRKLFKKIAAEGLISTLQDVDFSGAYALTFVDTKDGSLNIIRNDQRPLFTVYDKGKTVMYWASEKRILDFMISGSLSPSYFDDIKYLPSGRLLKFDLRDYQFKEIYTSVEDKIKPEVKPFHPVILLKKPEPTELSGLYCKYCRWNLKLCTCGSTTFIQPAEKMISDCGRYYYKDSVEEASPFKDTKPTSILDEQEVYLGFKKNVLTRERAEELLSCGCSMCPAVPHVSENAWWYTSSDYLCNNCYGDESGKQAMHNQSTYKSKYIKTTEVGKA